MSYHTQHKPLATLATTNRSSSRYLLFGEDTGNGARLQGWKNVKTNELKGLDGDAKAFSGIAILQGEIFNLISEEGKFSMIDVYMRLCKQYPIISYDHSHGKLVDIGTTEKLAIAETMFVWKVKNQRIIGFAEFKNL